MSLVTRNVDAEPVSVDTYLLRIALRVYLDVVADGKRTVDLVPDLE